MKWLPRSTVLFSFVVLTGLLLPPAVASGQSDLRESGSDLRESGSDMRESGSDLRESGSDMRESVFNDAMAKIRAGQKLEGYTTLVELAPISGPGYAPAHLQLARHLIGQGPQAIGLARRHIEHAASIDANDVSTKNLTMLVGRAIDSASSFQSAASNGNFAQSIEVFDVELANLNLVPDAEAGPDHEAKKGFYKVMLINACFARASQLFDQDTNVPRGLELLTRILQIQPGNSAAKSALAKVIFHKPDYAEQAKAIYDPLSDSDPPGNVLAELGTHFMSTGEIESAIKNLEAAQTAIPQNPLIINNLALCQLMKQEPDAERALVLVNQSLVLFEDRPRIRSFKTYVYDTQAKAYEFMADWEKAAEAYKNAIKDRPRDKRLLDAMLICVQRSRGVENSTLTEPLITDIDPANIVSPSASSGGRLAPVGDQSGSESEPGSGSR